jgi:hypothetical protein
VVDQGTDLGGLQGRAEDVLGAPHDTVVTSEL